MTRRLATCVSALLAVITLAAGLVAVDARLDHDGAGITITAVQQPAEPVTAGAVYDPGTWTDTVFVLLVGSDERAGLEGARGDALHVVGLNPMAQRATFINIPRDTWVDVPGHGQMRVNRGYELGGAQLQAETVRRLTGAPISYVITTTFEGVRNMVDALGGLEVDVPFYMDDQNSGAAFHQGRQRMNGDQVLAFSRNRMIPDGDVRRTANQGQVLIHALTDLRAKGMSKTDVLGYLDVLYRNVRTEGVGAADLFRLGRAAMAILPENVRNYTLPVQVGNVGSASVVFVRQPEATGLFVDFVDDAVLQGH